MFLQDRKHIPTADEAIERAIAQSKNYSRYVYVYRVSDQEDWYFVSKKIVNIQRVSCCGKASSGEYTSH